MKDYLTIITRYLEGVISPSEKEMLQDWLSEDLDHKILFKQKVKEWYASNKELPVDSELAYKRFIETIDKNKTKTIRLKSWSRIIKYAAVLGGILIGGYYYYTTTNVTQIKTNPTLVNKEASPVDKIRIVQADGKVTYMGFEDSSEVVNAKGNLIGKKNQGQFVVESGVTTVEAKYLEISIPKGKLFQLTLSDGTKVWLNAASSLKFPQHFVSTEKNRIVYLEGEAFFDVTTNKDQPFIVKTGAVDVEVLGTQFNVSSYAEDVTIKTTLVEGAVAINDPESSNTSLKLTPSYQAIFSKDKKAMLKKKVNTMLYTSWMNKKMILQNESFAEAYKRIERTYDVTITSNNDKLNSTRFTGEFDVENIEEILRTFSETLNFTYDIKDKNIVINP
ncbi:FecR family protein [Aquimarina sediminis]|uniref:FecR family protein n=1 Tax=Aquimarina sediminis TaxID=2070536 RepID=UPI000CA0841C|nr:FecR domain-containing protein [Aquimarina sediminis]